MFLSRSLSFWVREVSAASVSSMSFYISGRVRIVDSLIYLINDIFCEYFDNRLLAIDFER